MVHASIYSQWNGIKNLSEDTYTEPQNEEILKCGERKRKVRVGGFDQEKFYSPSDLKKRKNKRMNAHK